MSGSAFGRVQVSSSVKGVFSDGQQTRYHVYYIIDQRTGFTWNLLHFSCFTAFAVPKCLHLYK